MSEPFDIAADRALIVKSLTVPHGVIALTVARRFGVALDALEAAQKLIGPVTLCAECNGTCIPKPPKQPYCCPIGHARECQCTICQWRRYGYRKGEEIERLKAELAEARKGRRG